MNTTSGLTLIIVLFMGLWTTSNSLPTEDFLFSRYFDGESNCTGQSTVGTYGSLIPLGCFPSGSKSQQRQCNGTHYVVSQCSGQDCQICEEIASSLINVCEGGATLRTCQPITDDLIPTDALIKVVWDQPGDCSTSDFASIMIYSDDNECYHTNTTNPEYFEFVCNSTSGELFERYHSTGWCDNLVREEVVDNAQICLSTKNDQYSSNTLIGCSISALLQDLVSGPPSESSPPTSTAPSVTSPTAASPVANSPRSGNQPSGSGASSILPSFGALLLLSLVM